MTREEITRAPITFLGDLLPVEKIFTPGPAGLALKRYLEPEGPWNMRELSRAAGLSEKAVQAIVEGRSKNPRGDTLGAIARALTISITELVQNSLDARPINDAQVGITRPLLPPSNVRAADDKPPLPERQMMPRDVPVYGTAAGGNGDGCFELNQGDPIDFVRRGPGIEMAREVYCIYVEGESMVPWKEPGDLIYLDPARKPRVGDYVVVVVDGPSRGEPPRAFLKRLARRGPEQTVFQQYNPAKDVIFDTRLIKSMTRVLTMEEVLGV